MAVWTFQAADAISEKSAQLQDLQEEWVESARVYITSPGAALLLAVGANLLLALFLGWAIRRQRPHLQFPATVRSLTPDTEQSS